MYSVNARSFRALGFLAAIALIAFSTAGAAASPPAVSPQERAWEVQTGQQLYVRYVQRGEIVPRQSQLYTVLDPVANAVASIANQQYFTPFQFILLNEAQPNAFSIPGGNVYVTTAMLSYLSNRDELAGVLCHEVNHDIHHDMFNAYEIGQHGERPIAYERDSETKADDAGAYTCAKAGFNPWGMVWNMRQHRGMGQPAQMSAASDHPSDDQRLANLTALLTSDRGAFGKFTDDVAAAVPLPNSRLFARQYPPQYPGPAQYPMQGPAPYPMQGPAQYPMQGPAQYPQQTSPQPPPQMGPYPPPPLPPCYPGC